MLDSSRAASPCLAAKSTLAPGTKRSAVFSSKPTNTAWYRTASSLSGSTLASDGDTLDSGAKSVAVSRPGDIGELVHTGACGICPDSHYFILAPFIS